MHLFSKSQFKCDPTNQYPKRKTREEKETKDETQGSKGDIQGERQGDPDMIGEQGPKEETCNSYLHRNTTVWIFQPIHKMAQIPLLIWPPTIGKVLLLSMFKLDQLTVLIYKRILL